MAPKKQTSALLLNAKQMVSALKKDDKQEAIFFLEQLNMLMNQENSDVMKALGKLTRELHGAVKEIFSDTALSETSESEVSDAKDRLSHVLDMTEKASQSTLDNVDLCTKHLTLLNKNIDKIATDKIDKEMMDQIKTDILAVQKCTHEIMMTQSYQDLSGQLIKRVMELIRRVEQGLIHLIRMANGLKENQADQTEAKLMEGMGPQIKASDDVASNQDDIDALLKDLGM